MYDMLKKKYFNFVFRRRSWSQSRNYLEMSVTSKMKLKINSLFSVLSQENANRRILKPTKGKETK